MIGQPSGRGAVYRRRMSALAPVPPRDRVLTLDVLRGFALLGVIIGNMVLYSGGFASRAAAELSTLDEIAAWFHALFVQSKAQTLLTLLFGFGFAVQLLRAQERGEPVMGLYVRRLVVLLAFGFLHVTLLWWGDVMWGYAIAGFGLLAFVRASNRTRLVWAVVLTFVPALINAIPEVREAALGVFMEPRELMGHFARIGGAIQDAHHPRLAWEHLVFALAFSAQLWHWYFFWTLGRFLLGYVAGKLRWFDDDGAGHLPQFRRLAAWCGAIAVATAGVQVLVMLQVIRPRSYGLGGRLALTAIVQVGYLAMTLAYVGIVVLLMQRPRWRRALRVLAPVGRMPLTTYFTQSLFATFAFYGWGLGLAGRLGPAAWLGIALAIFTVQIAIAHLWLRRFRFGPLEWVWRTAVYLKPQPMRLT